MKIIRLKAVSLCLGIRRSYLAYIPYQNGVYSLGNLSHPIKVFNGVIIEDDCITVLSTSEELLDCEEVFFYKNRVVVSLNKQEIEQCVLGALPINLSNSLIDFYKDSIDKDIRFDEADGEYEYLLGLIYEYENNDIENAKIWYDKAINKGFKYKIMCGE